MATVTLLLRRVEPPPSPSSAIFSDATTLFPLLSPSQLLSFKTPKAKNQIHQTFNSKPLHVPLSNSFKNGSNNSSADTSCPVPFDQQPINEYQTLSTSFPFSWAAGDFVEYCSRLFVTGASFALLVGLPVAWLGAPGADAEPLKRILAAASSGVFVVTLAVVRMYLGWAYVGNRLLSATVEYEETGWYDGQVWVKTAEVLARDRLLGSFSVKPVLSKLKYTLVTLGVTLFICGVLLINDIDQGNNKDAYNYSDPKRAIPGVYKDESARYFEPDAFYTESAQSDASC